MVLSREFLLKLYDACYIMRWNEFLRPIDITEQDNQAFKMVVAYILAKIEEHDGKKISWIKLIKFLIFDFLKRVVLTDIKPEILDEIEKKYSEKLKEYILNVCKDILDYSFLKEFESFLTLRYNFDFSHEKTNEKEDIFLIYILNSAGKISSKWEYEKFIKDFNKDKKDTLDEEFSDETIIKKYPDLKSVEKILMDKETKNYDYKKFLDICFSLRYQIRWTGKHRIPKTSVLGHELVVSIITFMFFYENDLDKYEEKVIYNNFFTALFHDLPEALTRDIISPIKHVSKGISDLIKDIEIEEMGKIYNFLPGFIKEDIKIFTENEFNDLCISERKIRHGCIIKTIDRLSAIIEAYIAVYINGIKNKEFIDFCSKKNIENCIKDLNNFSEFGKIDNYYDFLETFILS